MHVLAINALGLHLLDYLQFEDLVAALRDAGPVVVPLRDRPAAIAGGTGSPVNPIAIV